MHIPTFKRKKNHTYTNKSRLVGVFLTGVLRRRLIHRLLISAISVCVLLLFSMLSLFAPSSAMENNLVRSRMLLNHQSEFYVPASGDSYRHDLWNSTNSQLFAGCSNAGANFAKTNSKTQPDRYVLIVTSGGLNQQRTGIIDAVVAAYILNATLVVPELDHASFWKDNSNFSELFDTDWFIKFLRNDIRVIKQLPIMGEKFVAPYTVRVPRKCTPKCYEDRVLPVLVKKRAVRLTKFDYRLSNMLDDDLQKLRCRVNYHALKFTDSIQGMGNLLVERMRIKSKHFIALHLRFEPDMLAFSGCYYGGGDKERSELGEIRKRWKNLHASNPDKERRHGRCPLTPEEVGLMLRALGFGIDTHMYVASGEIYGGEDTLAPLRALFPNFHSKDTLATKEELAPFDSFSSRMAALDYIVCDESDVFVTNNNGNMAKILAGRRRYFGHKPTIRPNGKKLNPLFMNKHNMTWEEFAPRVRKFQVGFMGEPNELKPGSGEFHENPTSCICQKSGSPIKAEGFGPIKVENRTENPSSEEDREWSELDYDLDNIKKQVQLKGTKIDSIPLQMGTDQVEVQEFFSD
ncbi:unnamed protein product [Vicia faba]|uniref:O-fucosyltransferase family protein n=1 Tax=Vicia faba TaxID=3906 RepID=A0AAV0YCT8_VICFA|nr:unnamed protein product [Vicia faba]